MAKFFFLFLIITTVSFIDAYPTGAPKAACDSMLPDHGAKPKTEPSPYAISFSKQSIKSGENIIVSVSGHTKDDTIKGFLLQARHNNKRVGHFEIPEDDTFVQPLDCDDIPASAATHKKSDGVTGFTVKWVAPEDLKGEVTFWVTIVKTKLNIWTGINEKLTIN